MKTTILVDLPEPIRVGYLKLESVEFLASLRACAVSVKDEVHSYRITFPDTVAFRVMDETEMGEFWAISIIQCVKIKEAIISRVESGGWQSRDDNLKNLINIGYFGENVSEYVIMTDYECVNLISNGPQVEKLS